jgi:hypothetical protein
MPSYLAERASILWLLILVLFGFWTLADFSLVNLTPGRKSLAHLLIKW